MTISVKHAFVSTKADGTDSSLIRASNWNDDHSIQIIGPALIGKSSSGAGGVTEITLGTNLSFSGNVLNAAGGGSSESYTLPIASLSVLGGIKLGTGLQITGDIVSTLFDGSYTSLSNKPIIPTVPTNVSSFTNDSNYQTGSQVAASITAAVPTNISSFTNDSDYQTSTQVLNAIASLIDSAPGTLNTLNELAAALGDDADFANTTATALGNRLRVDINNQNLTSTEKTNAKVNLGLSTVATSGSYTDLSSTPTNVSSFTNDSNYQTGSQVAASITAAVPTNISSFTNDSNYISTSSYSSFISSHTVTKTASGNLSSVDTDKFVKVDLASNVTLTLLNDASGNWSAAESLNIFQYGVGTITVTPDVGVTIRGTAPGGGQYTIFGLIRIGVNEWVYV